MFRSEDKFFGFILCVFFLNSLLKLLKTATLSYSRCREMPAGVDRASLSHCVAPQAVLGSACLGSMATVM
jgi:hypothetical protein